MRVTITNISRKMKPRRDGTGTYESVNIQCQEYGTEWLSGFGSLANKNWKVGTAAEINVTEAHINGRVFKNYRPITAQDKRDEVIRDLISRVTRIEKFLNL